MKIQVVHRSGVIETINLVGTVTVYEPGNELDFPRNQGCIHLESTGSDHFFCEDGIYDGWGMAVAIPCESSPEAGFVPSEARAVIDAVEVDREFPMTGGAV